MVVFADLVVWCEISCFIGCFSGFVLCLGGWFSVPGEGFGFPLFFTGNGSVVACGWVS